MFTNFHLARDAKKKLITSAVFDISGTASILDVLVSQTSSIKVRGAQLVYTVATDGGTRPESITVGVPGALTRYFSVTPAASTAQWTVTAVAPSSAVLVPKGTPLIITRSAAAGGTNTGEVKLVIEYEFADGDYMP